MEWSVKLTKRMNASRRSLLYQGTKDAYTYRGSVLALEFET